LSRGQERIIIVADGDAKTGEWLAYGPEAVRFRKVQGHDGRDFRRSITRDNGMSEALLEVLGDVLWKPLGARNAKP
jgi:hypothetical protein